MTSENELLPCPFCGGESHLTFTEEFGGFVSCHTVGCAGFAHVAQYNEDEIISGWNRRVEPAPNQAIHVELERALSDRDSAIKVLAGDEPTDGSAYYWACRVKARVRLAEVMIARLTDAVRSAQALAFCCMAEDSYSRSELRDIAKATESKFAEAVDGAVGCVQ